MYSLISAPVLGFDLSRLAGGATTAEILVAVMGSGPMRLRPLAHCASPDRTALRAARSAAYSLAGQRASVKDLAHVEPHRAVALLERAPIGNLGGLLACLRSDVLDPPTAGVDTEPAVSLIADALIATYLRDLLSDQDRRLLASAWLGARRALPPSQPDLGPQQAAISALLDRVTTMTADDIAAVMAAADRARGAGGSWAAAMHSATWAVHLSNRVRSAATAQLLLVQAVALSGVPVSACAAGAWNILSGGVQALVVRDLADSDSAHELLAPCLSALGLHWLQSS